jgi:hypothetical protein
VGALRKSRKQRRHLHETAAAGQRIEEAGAERGCQHERNFERHARGSLCAQRRRESQG